MVVSCDEFNNTSDESTADLGGSQINQHDEVQLLIAGQTKSKKTAAKGQQVEPVAHGLRYDPSPTLKE